MHFFLPRVVNEKFNIFIIFFFQFWGTMLFGYFNLNLINAKAESSSQARSIVLFYVDFSLSMFMCFAYGRQFSGGVYNPAIILFRMIRKTDRLSIKIGCIYMLAEFLGGILGSVIAMELMDIKHAPITGMLTAGEQINQFFTQIIGTFILTFMIQFMIEKKMTFIQHNREFYVAIPLVFMVSRAYSASSNGVNPAFGLSFQLTYAMNTGKWVVMEMCYVLIVGPYIGAALAAYVFEHAMKPMFPLKQQQVKQILENNYREKQKILLERVPIDYQQIDQLKQHYIDQALQIGIQLEFQVAINMVEQDYPHPKKINHRFSLGQAISQQGYYHPQNYKYLQQMTVIGEEDYFDDDIDSVNPSEQEQKSFKFIHRQKQKQLELQSSSINSQKQEVQQELNQSDEEIINYEELVKKYGSGQSESQSVNSLENKLNLQLDLEQSQSEDSIREQDNIDNIDKVDK